MPRVIGWPASRTTIGYACAGSVPRDRAVTLGRADDLAALVDRQPVAETGIAPAQADHLVVRRPVGERVIGCVDDRQSAPLGDVLLERLADLRRPWLAVVVAENHVILGELGAERIPRRTLGLGTGRGGHVHREPARTLQVGLHRRGHDPPVVVVLAVHDQHADLLLGAQGTPCLTRFEHSASQQADEQHRVTNSDH